MLSSCHSSVECVAASDIELLQNASAVPPSSMCITEQYLQVAASPLGSRRMCGHRAGTTTKRPATAPSCAAPWSQEGVSRRARATTSASGRSIPTHATATPPQAQAASCASTPQTTSSAGRHARALPLLPTMSCWTPTCPQVCSALLQRMAGDHFLAAPFSKQAQNAPLCRSAICSCFCWAHCAAVDSLHCA